METKLELSQMTRGQKIDFIVDYYNEHFKWQKLVYDQEIDREKVAQLTDSQLDSFIEKNCQ